MSIETVTAETYLVIVPNISNNGVWVYGARIDRLRSGKPALAQGEIAVRIKLRFDKQSLRDAIPVVEADVNSFVSAPTPALEVSS